MEEEQKKQFKEACKAYLNTVSVNSLRSYGRKLQLTAPTKQKKGALIQEILGVLCGEIQQERNNRGAPIKDDYIEPRLIEEIERLQKKYFSNEIVEKKEIADERVAIQLSVDPIALNYRQKQLLKQFINSL